MIMIIVQWIFCRDDAVCNTVERSSIEVSCKRQRLAGLPGGGCGGRDDRIRGVIIITGISRRLRNRFAPACA